MSSLWSQNVGRLLNQVPENGHKPVHSIDSSFRHRCNERSSKVNLHRNGLSEADKAWVDTHVHYINQQAGGIGGSLATSLEIGVHSTMVLIDSSNGEKLVHCPIGQVRTGFSIGLTIRQDVTAI